MQKNVTIRLSEEAADWARIEAAKRKTSVSRMLGEMLEREMQRAGGRRAFEKYTRDERWPEGRPEPGWKFSREETHDRERDRRVAQEEQRLRAYGLWKSNLALAERSATERASRADTHNRELARRP